MNASLLYQAYGVKDYAYASTEYKDNAISLISKQSCPNGMSALIVEASMSSDMARFCGIFTICHLEARPAICPYVYNAIGARTVRRHGRQTFPLLTVR